MPSRPRTAFKLLVVMAASTLFTACGDGTSKMKTTMADLVETPHPPYHRPIFEPATDDNPKPREPARFTNTFPVEVADEMCGQSVTKLEVLTTGMVQGDLRFNTNYRGNFSDPPNFTFPETNNSTELGPVAAGNLYLYYKYQVEIQYELKNGFELDKCFYGQMTTKPVPIELPARDIEFHDSTPQNDSSGREWNVPNGKDFVEFKKTVPVVSVDKAKNIVRFIDCPGGAAGAFGVGLEGKKMYVMVYAGACNRITHVKVYRIEFPVGKKPSMTEIPSARDLLQEVKSFSYSLNPFPT